ERLSRAFVLCAVPQPISLLSTSPHNDYGTQEPVFYAVWPTGALQRTSTRSWQHEVPGRVSRAANYLHRTHVSCSDLPSPLLQAL
ncbi:hypothetical protein BC835DRAFT_1393550, partial [Cytidiella melzeri]